MSTSNRGIYYDKNFKRFPSIFINPLAKLRLHFIESTALPMTFNRWIKQYSTIEMYDSEILTSKQVKELQKQMARLEKENLILQNAIAIFTPHSYNDYRLFIGYTPNTISNFFTMF